MADYTYSAIYKVRKWMIQEMFDAGVLNEGDYVHASPVVPIQQIPESFDNVSMAECGLPTDAPFIVYDYLVPGGYDTQYWNCRDEVMFWIYDYDIEKVFEIKEFLYDLFRRFDLAAEEINEFDDGDNPYKYQYFDVMMGLPTSSTDQIVDRYGLNMIVTYQYTRPMLASGRFA